MGIARVCRKCIHRKLLDEELECCPVCNIDLGCVPLEKLRPDHKLQDVRAKIFPCKRRKVDPPEVVTSVTLPVRRKERSLSSLVISTPRVSTHTAMTRRRSKSIARKALQGTSFSTQKLVKKEADSVEDCPESSSSLETLTKFAQSTRKNSATVEPSSYAVSDKQVKSCAEAWDGKVDLWKPFTDLVEVANRSKSPKCISQVSAAKLEPRHSIDSEGRVRRTKVKGREQNSKLQDGKTSNDPNHSESEKPKKLRRIRRKKAAYFGESSVSPQAVLDGANAERERRMHPIWLSLKASEDQDGNAPLPQIPASYLRIKDGSMPVSFIQKYLMRKLDLTNPDEIEIRCMGQSVVPTLELNDLVDLWLQTASTSQRVPAAIGSSAKDFVMVLTYARKVPAP
ncbi:unnamed protein product [Ilex paraguariensis]|uniref:E3 ubiquitin protein ligase DRIP2 n=1 Tax=Ilex paraguariensis TaxID=185542 RepID=A0ABC8RFP0_9AQUA